MDKLVIAIRRLIVCFCILYGFNMIGVYFNFILPINVFSILILFFFDAAGIILLILFKIIM